MELEGDYVKWNKPDTDTNTTYSHSFGKVKNWFHKTTEWNRDHWGLEWAMVNGGGGGRELDKEDRNTEEQLAQVFYSTVR
jgi:hypothetical protein